MAKPVSPPKGGGGGGRTVDAVSDEITNTSLDPVDQYVIPFSQLLGNDIGNKLTVTAADELTNGGGDVFLTNEDVLVIPDDPYDPTVVFNYTISDGKNSDTAMVTSVYRLPNEAPVAVDDVTSTTLTGFVTFPGTGYSYGVFEDALLANDSDPNGDSLEIIDASIVSLSEGMYSDGIEVFETANGERGIYLTLVGPVPTGHAVIEYIVSDGHQNYDTAKVDWFFI